MVIRGYVLLACSFFAVEPQSGYLDLVSLVRDPQRNANESHSSSLLRYI